MTEQYAFGCFVHRRVEPGFSSDGLYEVIEMIKVEIAAGADGVRGVSRHLRLHFLYQLVLFIEYLLVAAA
jgi:hypothetical protein